MSKEIGFKYLPGLPAPEWLHFHEPDGSISSKRFLDCTLPDLERHQTQMALDIVLYAYGQISEAEFVTLYLSDEAREA